MSRISAKEPAPRLAVGAILATITMWASSYVAVRWLSTELSPPSLALLRVLSGAIAITGIYWWTKRFKALSIKAVAWSAPMGVLLFSGFALSQNWAGQHLDAGTISVLVNLAPLIVALGAGLVFGEGFPPWLFAGITISLSGISLIAYGSGMGELSGIGVIAGLVAAVCYGAGMLVQKKALQYADPLTCSWLACCFGALTLTPFIPHAITEVIGASIAALLVTVYIGAGPLALGFWLWGYALTQLPAGKVAASSLTVPAIAMALSVVLLGELPPSLAVVGGGLCVAGVVVAQWRKRAREDGK